MRGVAVSLVLAFAGCRSPAHLAAPTAWASAAMPVPVTEVEDTPAAEKPESKAGEEHRNRLTLVLADAVEGLEVDFTVGFEYEHRIHEHWGVGALVDRFQGDVDETLVAASVIYHPVRQVGLAVNPGYQFRDGESGRFAVRVGMFYDFEINEWFSIAPLIYTDYISDGVRAAILGIGLNWDF